MSFVILAALGICFGYSVLERGGVGWNDWSLTLLGVGVLGCLHFLWNLFRKDGARLPRLDPITGYSAAAFLCLVAFQIVPLPASLVRHLSPKRAELQQAAAPFTNASSSQSSTPSSIGFVTLSAVPRATTEYLLTTSSYVLVFLLIRDLSLRLAKFPWAPAIPFLIVVGLEAVLGLLQVSSGAASGFATGTYASRDHYAGLIEMALPFPVMFAVAALRRDPSRADSALPAVKASLLLGVAAIMLVAIVLSLSRMGFLAALASLLVAGVAAVSLGNGGYSRGRLRTWVPAAAVALVVLLGLLFLPTNPLLARFADMTHTSDISPDTRVQIWRDTTGLVKDYPLFGCGMGGFESCFLKYKTAGPMYTVDYAHNDYLQVLAELGLFGFAAGLLFVGRVFQRSVQGIFRSDSIDGRHLAIACVASMTAMLLHSFVDFNMYVPANGMLFAWVAGIAGVYTSRSKSQPELIP